MVRSAACGARTSSLFIRATCILDPITLAKAAKYEQATQLRAILAGHDNYGFMAMSVPVGRVGEGKADVIDIRGLFSEESWRPFNNLFQEGYSSKPTPTIPFFRLRQVP